MRQINLFNFLTLVAFLLISTRSIAQTPRPVPAAYSSSVPVSYVRVWTAAIPSTDASTFSIGSDPAQASMATQYVNGLGRSLQTVVKKGSLATDPNNPGSASGAVDVVSAVEYDEFGREQFKYMPFAAYTNNGLFKLDPFQQQATFSATQYPGEQFYYSQTQFEASPLNRTEKVFAQGNSWVGSGRGVSVKHWVNTATDAVRICTVTNAATTGDFGGYASSTTFSDGQLYKTATEDERGKQVIEFTDKEGKVILKKVQLLDNAYDNGTGKDYTGWLSTYYLYDELGRLRCVVQPKGVELLLQNGWDFSALNGDILKEQCFRYEYDERGRMIVKKVPGAKAPSYMVYDARDRLVMMQDGNMGYAGIKKWMVTLYDNFNRPIQTGLWNETQGGTLLQNWSYHANQAAIPPNYPFSSATTPGTGWELLTETHYDNYISLPAGLSASLVASGYASYLTASSSAPDYAQPILAAADVKGMVTWTRVKVIGEGNFLSTVNIYDDKGRVIQVQSINYTGGVDMATTQYSFAGQVLRSHLKHEKAGGVAQTYQVGTKNNYDALKRLISIEKSINGSGWKVITSMEYDALGQVKKKKIGISPTTGSPLETQVFDYNIRGWLLGVNKNELANNGSSPTKFSFELGYDKQTNTSGRDYAASQYNGNITGMIWKSAGDGIRRKYDFGYDNVNRLLRGDFEQNDAGATWGSDLLNFTVKMGDGINASSAYDANGNIKAMTQYGWKLGTPANTPIDNLSYNYIPGTNKLLNVIDASNDPLTKLGDFRTSTLHPNQIKTTTTEDYTYDVNGNLKKDLNKDIGDGSSDGIVYNHLNLPQTITVKKAGGAVKGTITYTYDAGGGKLKKEVLEAGQPLKTTLYLFGTYENDVLQFLPQEEGRVRPLRDVQNNITGFTYDYMLKDHLGNVRVVLTEEQQTDPYPAASMETAQATTEEAIYSNVNTTRTNLPSGYPTDTYTNPNDKVAKTNGSGNKIGPALVLKVMAGDKFNLRVSSWYKTYGASPGTPVDPFTDLVSVLATSVGNISGTHGGATVTELQNSGVLSPGATNFLNTQVPDVNKPKAYINWILFDEQFKYVGSSSGAEQVGANEEFKVHLFNDKPIDKSGYLYVYVSNETPNIDVFFDNLQVTHIRGPLLETNQYYPFGLLMKNLSYRSLKNGYAENKKMFNAGTELNTTFDINLYETNFRSLDPQLGRFWQVDPMADIQYENSPYSYGNNNPLTFNDPLGLYNDTTGNNPSVMPTVTVTAKAKVPSQFLPYLTPNHDIPGFPNNEPITLANSQERPFALNNKSHSVYRDYIRGTGATNRVYPAWHHMTKRLMNANQVLSAMSRFYKKYGTDYKNGLQLRGVNEHYASEFGFSGLLGAGFDMVEQFVGGMDINIIIDEKGENLLFILSNTTGKTSQYYHMADDQLRNAGEITPGGNLYQRYVWSMPINEGFKATEVISKFEDVKHF